MNASPRAIGVGLMSLALCMYWACPSAAVDRSIGADIPKPTVTGVPWNADALPRLDADLDGLLDAAPTLHGAHVGLLVLDTATNTTLYERHADDAFAPASTFKLLTGSAALILLGPHARLRTEALRAGSDLYLRVGGDPYLGVADLDAMAQSLTAAGERGLRNVFVDAWALEASPYPRGWVWDDFPFDYAPQISAATIEHNVLHLRVTPGSMVGDQARLTVGPPPFDEHQSSVSQSCADRSQLSVISGTQTGAARSADSADVTRTADNCIATVGAIPLDATADSIDAAVPHPVWYLRELALQALRTHGVAATGAQGSAIERHVPSDARIVWSHESEPLSDLLADMWLPSDNLAAELLLREMGRQAAGAPGSTEHGVAAERTWLASIGVDPAAITIADGSGLSIYDRVTPRVLAAILQYDWNGPNRDTVLDDLSIAGVRGTLASSFRGTLAERRTFAKDGVVNHTRGLAGYLVTLRHGAVTFAWSVDDWMGNDDDLHTLRARVLARIIGD